MPEQKKTERVLRLVQLQAGKPQTVEELTAGDIGAVIGWKNALNGDTLRDPKVAYLLEPMRALQPVISLTIEAENSEQEKKLHEALLKIAMEDPTFFSKEDPETGQTLIMGMGELHLEVITHRLQREFHLGIRVGKPQISYRETITTEGMHTALYQRELGGKAHYAQVTVKVTPQEESANTLEWNVAPQTELLLPSGWKAELLRTLEQSFSYGILKGYPLIQLRVSVEDLDYQSGKTSLLALDASLTLAFRYALEKAAPILLEPIMTCTVTCPLAFVGEVMNQLSTKRATIQGTELRGEEEIISCLVPLKHLFGYSTELRSRTQGRAYFTSTFSHFSRWEK